MYKSILFEKKGCIAYLILNRPDRLNALSSSVLEEIDNVLSSVEADMDVHVLIIKGAGEKALAAGADITEMQAMDAMSGMVFGAYGQSVFSKIEKLRLPVIASIQGFALGGGCELALACDIRVASCRARFGQPEVGLGITAGFGGTQRLPRLIGRGAASLLLFSGEMIDAGEALRVGLVDKVVPHEELDSFVDALAEKIAHQASFAVQQSKRCIRHGIESGLEAGLSYEAQAFGLCFSTQDQKSRMEAFVNRR